MPEIERRKWTQRDLERVSKLYDSNFDRLMKYVNTPWHVRYILEERRLTALDKEIRRYLRKERELHEALSKKAG